MLHFSVLSWNIQGRLNFTGFTFFKKIKPHLLHSSADIIALQEMCDAEKILKKTQIFKQYYLFIPQLNKRTHNQTTGFNHNVLLSKYPILAAQEMSFPPLSKKVHVENCIRADIQITNQIVRIYNCHFPIYKTGVLTRLKQLEYILSDAVTHNGPTIICGDMNITIPKKGWNRKVIRLWHKVPKKELSVNGNFIDYDERELFNKTIDQHGFKEMLDLYTPTWSPLKSSIWQTFGLKLDWFIVKNLGATNYTLGTYVSDHRSIEVRCQIG